MTRSIAAKVLLALALALVVGLALFYSVSERLQKQLILEQAQEQSVLWAQALADTEPLPTELGDTDSGACVVDAAGQSVSEACGAWLDALWSAAERRAWFESQSAAGAVVVGGWPSVVVHAVAPLSDDSERWWWVAQRLDGTRVDTGRGLLVLFGIVAGALVIVVGFLLLDRAVVRRVRQLTREADRMRPEPHDHDRPGAGPVIREGEGGDEVAQLEHAFRELRQRLSEYSARTERALSEQRDALNRLHAAQQTLVRNEKLASVGILTAGIAHEIGNPVSIVLGYLELLDEESLTEEQRHEFVGHIRDATERMSTIIHDLLDFSRPGTSDRDAEPLCHPREVAERTLKLLRPQPRFRNIETGLTGGEGSVIALIHDHRLEQILVNLALNAADAMEGEGTLEIEITEAADTSRPEAPSVAIEVRDSGPGVAPEDAERIFDPFYTTKRPGKGTGLGLSISHQMATTYNGSLSLAPAAPGTGAHFRLVLPAAPR